ncbi:transcriptional repressor [Campylobacter sp. Cr9]|uniref:transcriptional repressor n=1 Tax=unclassified Campylobacter TaxID=2593542 RepID=UPI001EFBF8A9|nr:transcriptional repressor [Campylobacter sp. RM5004]MBZ7986120.1 transcriptional repressor [Campylobacter sp. Cr9]ULO02337.1 transcriptional regulator, Fur family [Campylobacter sp. RM5004]
MNSVKLLKKHDIGITELRILLLDELLAAKEPMCFDDFKTKANKTTFYRTMEQFQKAKLINKIELDGKGYYQINKGNNALFVCDICHHTQDLAFPSIDKIQVSSVLVKGVCKDCKDNNE